MRSQPFAPKTGDTVRVLGVCRISTTHQDPRSLEDQEAYYREWLTRNVSVPWTLEIIASQGSGENLERKEYLDLIERCADYDLILTEDLGRICRRVHAHVFCENAIDERTRVIAINDNVDTAEEGWELSSYFAVIRHEAYNKDTSRRIRRSLRNRFNQGGVIQELPYGYTKPHSKATDTECFKNSEAEAIYKEWFDRLDRGQTFSEIADWLNASGTPVGPYCRSGSWNCKMVGSITFNTILKGERRRNNRITERTNSTGRKKTVKASPAELLVRNCPNLAFFEPAYYDGVVAKVRLRNEKYRRGKNGTDCRANVPRKRTRWPGQRLRCGICGRKYLFGGHGQTSHLMCEGARLYKCWNGVSCDAPTIAQRALDAIRREVEALDGFGEHFHETIRQESVAAQEGLSQEIDALERQEPILVRSVANFTGAIGEVGFSQALLSSLKTAETQLADLRLRLQRLRTTRSEQMPQFPDPEAFKEIALAAFRDIDISSPQFWRLMCDLVSDVIVYPYEMIGGGHPCLKAVLQVNLLSFLPSPYRSLGTMTGLQRTLIIDLADRPLRELLRPAAVAGMKVPGANKKCLAAQLGTHPATIDRALQLQLLMDSLGLHDPYIPLRAPHDGVPKLTRHHHARYRFEPLAGFEVPNFPEEANR